MEIKKNEFLKIRNIEYVHIQLTLLFLVICCIFFKRENEKK